MIKLLLGSLLLLGVATPALAQSRCDRTDLQTMVDGYLAAQTSGDSMKLPLADGTQYTEQGELATMTADMLAKPQRIDFQRTLFDLITCSTFTEVVIANPAHPYVIGTRLQFSGKDNPIAPSRVNEIESVITDAGDWLFNAANTLKYSKAEKWTEIPVADRDTRATILAAANAYLDSFNDKSVIVPWGSPCARLEGGLYTAKGAPGGASPDDTCNVGVPSGQKLVDRHYVVDEALGAVAVFLTFGANKLPDVHTFRIEKGKIRYVHTITVCKTANCGFPLPPQLQATGG